MKLACCTVLLSVLTAGCDSGQRSASSTSRDDEPIVVPPEPATSPVRADEILAPREGSLDLADYVATDVTLRLFGVELGDGSRPPSAVLADTTTWATRSYEEGALVGRGWRVDAIGPDVVRLRSSSGTTELRPGEDVRLRWVRHLDDRVARSLGRHRYVLSLRAARAAEEVVVVDPEIVEIYGRRAWRLPPLHERSLLAAAGFREGDLVVEVNGVEVDRGAPGALRSALLSGDAARVRVVRAGVPLVLRYVADAR